jgi:hypothetical protein
MEHLNQTKETSRDTVPHPKGGPVKNRNRNEKNTTAMKREKQGFSLICSRDIHRKWGAHGESKKRRSCEVSPSAS